MFDGDLNVQIGGKLLKIRYTNLTVMCGIEQTVPLFFKYDYKILIVNQIILAHKLIYNLFGFGIYHKPHYKFKSKLYEFQNRNLGLFSENDTRMAGYVVGMHIDMRMRKALLDKVSCAQLNSVVLNSKLPKVVSYIQYNTYWESIYVILK